MPDKPSRDVYELEPLEPRLLLSGDPISALAGAGLVDFISDRLDEFAADGLGNHQATYVLNEGGDPVSLGGFLSIDEPTVIFDIEVEGLSQWSGTVSITAGSLEADFGGLAKAEITDNPEDGDDHALTATYTLTNATTTTGGIFSLGLDQVSLSIADEVITATATGLTLTFSPTAGFTTEGFSFPTIKANLATGPPGDTNTVIDASGSGLILLTDDGVAAEVSLTLTTGPSFPSQSFSLSGDLTLRLNTTGAPVTSIEGNPVDLPSDGGETYIQVAVSNASLTIGSGSSVAVLTADELVFEQSGSTVTLSGQGMAFVLRAGSSQVVKATSDAVIMQFVDAGFVASVEGASVEGPQLSGDSFTLSGSVDFAVNTTGSDAALPGVGDPVPGNIDGSVYVKATVRGPDAENPATLAIGPTIISATELVFERNDDGVGFSGVDLSIELKAGSKRIVGVSGASFAFQFIEQGFYGALVNAAIQGPDFTDASDAAIFALAGTVALRVNTTTDPRQITVNGEIEDLPAGSPGSPAIRVEITGDPPGEGDNPAVLTVAGSTLTAAELVFEQADGEVKVSGATVTFQLNAGDKRVLGVSNATFGFVFNEDGFVGALRDAEVQGPEFANFDLVGTVDLDINTTGATANLDGFGDITGVADDVYIKATVTGGKLSIQGNELTSTTLTFEKNGDAVSVGGTDTAFELKTGGSKILKVASEAFFLQFSDEGFVGAVKDATVSGPQFDGFNVTGAVSLQINTTGAAVAVPVDLDGDGDDTNDFVPGNAEGIFLKASVSGAVLSVENAALLEATRLDFEWSEDGVSLGGENVTFQLKAGAKRIIGISNANFAFQFTGDGFYGAMHGGTLQGPDFADFTLQGSVTFLINTTTAGQSVTVAGVEDPINLNAATVDTPYLRVEVSRIGPEDPAALGIFENRLAADKLIFELDGSDVTLQGEGLFFELKAGSKRILTVEVEAFYFLFNEVGFVGAVVNADVTGPDIDGFNLQGTVTLLINTSGLDPPVQLPIDINGDGEVDELDVVPGNLGGIYLKATVANAVLSIQDSISISADTLEFEYSAEGVSLGGANVSFKLQAGSTRIIELSGVDFAFEFVEDGFFGALRNGTLLGPDIPDFTLQGVVSFYINTTLEDQQVTIPGEVDPINLPAGAVDSAYLRVEVLGIDESTPAGLGIAGSRLGADAFFFELDGNSVTLAGTNVFFELRAGDKRIVGLREATFFFAFVDEGFYGSMRDAIIEGPDFGDFTLTGKVSFDINTTGLPQAVELGGEYETINLSDGGGSAYVRVEVAGIDESTPATLAYGDTFSLEVDLFTFEQDGNTVAVEVQNLVFKIGDAFTLTGELDMVYSPEEFRINNALLSVNEINIADVIKIGTPTISLEDFVVTGEGDVSGLVTISASDVRLFEDNESFSVTVEDDSGDGYALIGSFNLGTGAFSLTLDKFTLSLGDAFNAVSTGVTITYDPEIEGRQLLVKIDTGTISFPKLGGLNGSLENLEIWTDGFSVDELVINHPGQLSIGPVLELENLTVRFENFELFFGESTTTIGGSISVEVDSATLLPGKPVTGSVEGMVITFNFADGAFTGLQFTADTLTFDVGTFLSFVAEDVMINTEAVGDDFVVSFGLIGGTLKAGSFMVSAEGRNFGITAEGDFRVIPGEEFSVSLSVSGVSGNSLQWPSWLPIAIDSMELTWPDFSGQPLNFQIKLDARVTGFFGQDNLEFTGSVRGLVIDIGLLAEGKFPVTELAELGVFIKGPLFGGEIEAGLTAGFVKIDKDTGFELPSNAEGDHVESVFFLAVLGGFKLPGVGGLSLRVAFSERGPLAFYIEAAVPILLDPNTGLTLDRLRGGVEFSKTIPEPADAFALRSDAFAPPGELSLEEWRDRLVEQIGTQVVDDVTFSDPGSIFQNPMVISAGADLYTTYASKFTFRAEVDLSIDTTGKILINASAVFGDTLNAKTYLYADLTEVQSGKGRFLFLVDLPEQVGELDPLLSVFGEIKFEFVQELTGGSEPLTSAQVQALNLTDVRTDSFTLGEGATDPSFTLGEVVSSRASNVHVTVDDVDFGGDVTLAADGRTITVEGTFAEGTVFAFSYKVDGTPVTDSFSAANGETLGQLELSTVPVLTDVPADAADVAALIGLEVTLNGSQILVYGDDYFLNLENWTVVLTPGIDGPATVTLAYEPFRAYPKTGPPEETTTTFRVTIAGGAVFTLPGDLSATASGEIVLSFNSERFRFQFSASMEISFVGQVGVAAGEFVVEKVDGDYQVWGAVQVNAGEALNAFLEPKGITLEGTARLSLNTSDELQTVDLRFPIEGAVAPFTPDELETIPVDIKAKSFTFFIDTTAAFSAPGSGERLFGLTAQFFLEITPERLEVFANGTLDLGPEGAEIASFQATALFVVNSAGIGGRFTLIMDASGIEGVEFGAAFHLAFNTTGERIEFLIPELPTPVPDILGPALPFNALEPTATELYETTVSTPDGDARAIIIPAGAPPVGLTTPAEWTVDPGSEGFYLYIFGGGGITILDQFTLAGTFSIIVSDHPVDGLSFRLDFAMILDVQPLGNISAAGTLDLSSAGILASIDLNFSGSLGGAEGIEFTGQFFLEINTRGTPGQVTRLVLDEDGKPLTTLETELVDIDPDTIRIFAAAEVSVLGVLEGHGGFLFEKVGSDVTILWTGYLALRIDGTDILEFSTSGFIAVRAEGIAARLSLTLEVGGDAIPGFSMNAGFALVLNTTGTEVSYEIPATFPQILGPNFADPDGPLILYETEVDGVRTIVVPAGPPGEDITATWVPDTTTDYLVIVAAGEITLGEAFTLTGSFRLDVTGLGTLEQTLEMRLDMLISLEPLGSLTAFGHLIITPDGVVASVALAANASLGDAEGAVGISFTAAFSLEINTTGGMEQVERLVLDENFVPTGAKEQVGIEAGKVRVFAGGTVDLAGFLSGRGAFVFERDPSGRLTFLWGGEVTLSAGPAELFTFSTSGLVVIQDNGIAASVGLTIGVGELVPGFSFNASFYLILNTTGEQITYFLPSGFPTVLGPDLANPGDPAIPYETTVDSQRALVIAAGPPPAETIGATWTPTATGDYVIIVGSGTLSLLDTLEFEGAFRFEISNTIDGTVVDLRMSASLSLAGFGEFDATALLRITPDGVVAAINLNLSVGTDLDLGGVTVTGRFFLELNTTSTPATVQRPVVDTNGQVVEGEFNSVTLESGEWRVFVAAGITIGDFMEGSGAIMIEQVGDEFRLVLEVRLLLKMGAATLLSFDASGFMLVNDDGFAVRLQLTIASNGVPGVEFSGSFALIANTTGSRVEYILPDEFVSDFEGPNPAGDGTESYIVEDGDIRKLIIPEGAPPLDGVASYRDWSPAGSGDYFVIVAAGEITLLDVVTMSGGFRIVVSEDPFFVEVAFSMETTLGPLGTVTVHGGFLLTNDGIAAGIELDIGFHPFPGFSLTATFAIEINTTNSSQNIPRFDASGGTTSITANTVRIYAAGSISIFNIISGSGTFLLTIKPDLVEFHADISFTLIGVIHLNAVIDGAIYGGANSGLAFRAALGIDTSFDVIPGIGFGIKATGILQINSTGILRNVGVHNISPGFRLEISASIDLASVIEVRGTLIFTISEDGSWRITVPQAGALTADFFGLATIRAWGFFQSDGQFDIHVRGNISLGGGGTGLFGSITFDASFLDENNDGAFILRVSASISGQAKLFGITLAGFSADLSYNSDTGKISVRVTVTINLLVKKVSKSMTFTLGYFKLNTPPPFRPAGNLTNGTVWTDGKDNGGDGVLYLNMGSRAIHRSNSAGDYLRDGGDETFMIRHIAGLPEDADGATIEIIGLGRKATFTGVTKIVLLDSGSGDDVIVVGNSGSVIVDGEPIGAPNFVPVPFYANTGADDDAIMYYGTGNRTLGTINLGSGNIQSFNYSAVINGGTGNDFIEVGEQVSGPVWLQGGAGDDSIIHRGTGGGIIDGGGGDDVIYWEPGMDHLGLATITGGSGEDTLFIAGTSGADSVNLSSLGGNSMRAEVSPSGSAAVTIDASSIEIVELELVGGADTVTVNHLGGSGVNEVNLLVSSQSAVQNRLFIDGGSGPDEFIVTTETIVDEDTGAETRHPRVSHTEVAAINFIGAVRGSVPDQIIIDAGGGSDTIDAQTVTLDQAALFLHGNAGNDRIIGSPFDDVIDGGSGTNTLTGGGGYDIFMSSTGTNTLVEQFDNDMLLLDNYFVVGSLTDLARNGVHAAGDNPGGDWPATAVKSLLSAYGRQFAAGATVEELTDPVGGHAIFNKAVLVGGAGNNALVVGTSTGEFRVGTTDYIAQPWTGEATLDNRANGGAGNNGYYIVHLNGADGASIDIADNAVDLTAYGMPAAPAGAGYDELYVLGTAGADQITMRAGAGHVAGTDPRGLIYAGDPDDAANRIEITHRNVDHVTVRTFGGADQVDAERTVVATVIETGAGNDTVALGAADAIPGYQVHERWAAVVIDTGSGNDDVTIGVPGIPANTVNGVQGHVFVRGGAGANDTLAVIDSGDAADNEGHLRPTTVRGLGMGTFGITYTEFADLNIDLGSGDDTFFIHDTHAGTTTLNTAAGNDQVFIAAISEITTVNTGAGNDTVTVGALADDTPGTLDNIGAHLVLDGGAHTTGDTLILRDDADTTKNNRGEVTEDAVTGLGLAAAGITYTAFEILEIYLGGASGTFYTALFIDSTHTGTTTVYGSPGDDVFRVRSIAGETTLLGGAGNDRFLINVFDSTNDDPVGPSPDDPPHGAETGINGIGATLNLDGEEGTDKYWIYLAGHPVSGIHPVSIINVHDTGEDAGADWMRLFGTADDDLFLIRREFVALMSSEDTAERINYAGLNAGIRIDGRSGDDHFIFDDTGVPFTVYGGDGADRFQVGQMFDSPRVSVETRFFFDHATFEVIGIPTEGPDQDPGLIATLEARAADETDTVEDLGLFPAVVAPGDEIRTFLTTRGWLSHGTSHNVTLFGGDDNDTFTIYHNEGPLFLFGEGGDDTFVVRAFALYGSTVGNPDRELTTVDGGGGNDYIEYAVNAPVQIDGGEGFNTLVVIGTEFGDRFVIMEDGIFGAGLFVTFVNIQSVNIYGAEGDDHFVIVGTPAGTSVEIWGGLGSDTFEVGGQPITVVSRDLRGHSGVIDHDWPDLVINGDDVRFSPQIEGVSVNVMDNDAPFVVISETNGPLVVAENPYGLGLDIANYTVVLTRPPSADEDKVYVTVSVAQPSFEGAAPVLVYDADSADPEQQTPGSGVVLTFTSDNWYVPQTVSVTLGEGTGPAPERTAVLAHTVTVVRNDTPVPAGTPTYEDHIARGLPVRVLGSEPAIAVVEDGTGTRVIEGGDDGHWVDYYWIIAGAAPDAGETVTVGFGNDGQLGFQIFDGATWVPVTEVSFTAANWSDAVRVKVVAVNDSVVEGRHVSVVHHDVSTSNPGGAYAGVSGPSLDVTVYDNDVVMAVVTETGGSTDVIEFDEAGPVSIVDALDPANPFADTYSIVLTADPLGGAMGDYFVTLSSRPTPTTNAELHAVFAGDPDAANIQVLLSLTGNDGDWHEAVDVNFGNGAWATPQTIYVKAVNDSVVDGTDIKAFGNALQQVDGIRGPLRIEGDEDPLGDVQILPPLLYVDEQNPDPDSAGIWFPEPVSTIFESEEEQIDVLIVNNSDSVADTLGYLDPTGIWGLGMHAGATIEGRDLPAGIVYGGMEMLEILLGTGNDRFQVIGTHGGSTAIHLGEGDDIINVQSVSGHTTLYGGPGNDVFNVGSNHVFTGNPGYPSGHGDDAPGGVLDGIDARLIVVGGDGDNTLNVDDSGDVTADVGVLTETTLEGLDLQDAVVWTLTFVQTYLGTFGFDILIDGQVFHVGGLDTRAGGAELREGIKLALELDTGDVPAVSGILDVVVDRAGNRFTIVFVVDETRGSEDIVLSLNPEAIVDGEPEEGEEEVELPLPGERLIAERSTLNLLQGITVNADAGEFTIALSDGEGVDHGSRTFAVGIDPAALRTQLYAWFQETLGVGNVFLKDFLIAKHGNTYYVAYQGLLGGSAGTSLLLSAATPTHVVQAVDADTATVAVNAAGGAFRLDVGDGRLTPPMAHDAGADAIAEALAYVLGDGVTVVDSGTHFIISYAGASGLQVDGAHLVPVVEVARRTSGISYYGISTLNIDLGSGGDVFNIRGTSATTNVYLNGGDDKVFVSSAADEDLESASEIRFLEGNLDRIFGPLNLSFGEGRHKLMISDEAALEPDDDVHVAWLQGAPPIPGVEIGVTGLAPAPITYGAAPSGNFADGITLWSGWGADVWTIEAAHLRDGIRTPTSINTGLGDDHVTVELLDGRDGFFVLNTQGPYDDYSGVGDLPAYADDDFVDASASTRPLIIFGGQGDDEIHGGQGGDIIFGDRGRLAYTIDDDVVAFYGTGGPGDFTSPNHNLHGLAPWQAFTWDPTIGGDDRIFGGAGQDILFGGLGDDLLRGGDSSDLLVGDHAAVVFGDPAGSTHIDGPYGLFDRIDLVIPGATAYMLELGFAALVPAGPADLSLDQRLRLLAGDDTIYGDDGDDIIIGGAGSDRLDGGRGDDLIFGDNAIVDRTGSRGDVWAADPRYRELPEGVLYDLLTGEPLHGSTARPSPDGAPAWADFTIEILDHSFDIEANHPGLWGHDTIAGGPGNDLIFGQLGDDVIQGDGSIDLRPDLLLYAPEGVFNLTDLLGRLFTVDDFVGVSQEVVDRINSGDVGAWRLVPSASLLSELNIAAPIGWENPEGAMVLAGFLFIRPSVEDLDHVGEAGSPIVVPGSDGDDYIEGGGGADTIFGGLGQDDIVGGSSSFYDGLRNRENRPDGGDFIFGGSGTRIGRNDLGMATMDEVTRIIETEPGGHARDADVIAGDNANIYRAVFTTEDGVNYYVFGYDNYDTYELNGRPLRIIPRIVELLDYTPGGPDFDPAAWNDIGGSDEIHGEGGDDGLYGMKGDDVLYGDGQDDDIIGGYGNNWISGGAGDDGIIGDDGRIFTSRNGIAEPLYGIAAIPPGGLNAAIQTPGKIQQATINVSGQLKKTVILEPFHLFDDYTRAPEMTPSNDIIFGGWGNDFIHGGAGDDAISGAEALPEYFYHPVNPGDILGFGRARPGEFAAYDEYNPLRKVYVDASGHFVDQFAPDAPGDMREFILNFDPMEGPLDYRWTADGWAPVPTDGDDRIFGDTGNDWIVGGTGRDHMYGGWGDDLINADDNHETNGGLNDAPDTHPSYEDLAFGGAGRDVLIGNTGGDRLIDWAGEFNSYIVPFAPFGLGTVSRALQPGIMDFLYQLSASDGADYTRAAKTGADPARNGEPEGELGLVKQQDFAWQDQTGAPDDPQPGNIPGGNRDVLRSASFNDGSADGFFIDSGEWTVSGGRYVVGPESLGEDAVAVYHVGDPLPVYYEIRATISAVKPIAGYKANAYIIFDYQSPTDFKFAGLNSSTNKIEMGRRTDAGWIVDVQAPMLVKHSTDFNLLLAVNGTTATLLVNNKTAFSHAFAPHVIDGYSYNLNTGMVGIGADNAKGSFDNVAVQILPPSITLEQSEDFEDGTDSILGASQQGDWNVSDGRLEGSISAGDSLAFKTVDLGLGTNSYLLLQTALRTGEISGIIFDYYGPEDFKFAGIDVATQQVIIGHQTRSGWVVDAAVSRASLSADTTHHIEVSLKGTTVSVTVDGQAALGYVFNAPVVDGEAGVFVRNGSTSIDSFLLKTDDPKFLVAEPGEALMAAYAAPEGHVAAGLEYEALTAVVEEAIRRFASLGLSEENLNRLRAMTFEITDLDGLALGRTDGSVIRIDVNAAGFGWYTEAGIESNRHFLAQSDDSRVAGRMDLLTVVMHEFGHVLGIEHSDEPGAFMSNELTAGARILPTRSDLNLISLTDEDSSDDSLHLPSEDDSVDDESTDPPPPAPSKGNGKGKNKK